MEQEIKSEAGGGALLICFLVALVVAVVGIWLCFYQKNSTESTLDYTKFMEDQ